MADIKHKIDSAKHKVAKTIVENDETVNLMVAFFGAAIGVVGLYTILDKAEDDVVTNNAPQVVADIKQDISKLSELSQKFDYIKDYIVKNGKAPFSEREVDNIELNFNNTANEIFSKILTDNNISEKQASELWDLASEEVSPKSVSDIYRSDYDFGFLKEAREDVTSSELQITSKEDFTKAVSKRLYRIQDQKTLSAFGLFGLFSFAPFWMILGDKIVKWAENPPRKKCRKKKTRFKHGC